jgi:cell division septation protein DedD
MSGASSRRNASGETDGQEFEFTLGNKSMLTVFFVVVFLLGIFFAMGYAVGRNSAPLGETVVADAEEYDRTGAPSAVPLASETRDEAPPIPDSPAGTISTATPAAPIPALTVTQPQAGRMYLQVLAVAKPEAEVLAEVLMNKGFRAMVAPGPNDRVFRVLVGPAKDMGEAGKLKTDLESAGFKPFVKRY